MNLTKCLVSLAGMMLALAVTMTSARAQATPAPAPAATQSPTPMDALYDGRTHVTVAPYVWVPSLSADYQYSVPTLRGNPIGVVGSVKVGPSNYLPKLNSAFMAAVDVRKGDLDFFGDLIYLNASTSGTTHTVISGPLGLIQVPVTFNSTARISVALWEAAVGYTVAQGHNADLEGFIGVRQFPLRFNFSYNAIIGNRGIIAPSGTITTSDYANDFIFGLRGRAFLSNSHWMIPYYIDYGTGNNNETWEGFTGGGYAFNHGQSLVALWRSLNYNSFPPGAHVQKISMYGPLLGYTFQL